jgi:hypothetical protein
MVCSGGGSGSPRRTLSGSTTFQLGMGTSRYTRRTSGRRRAPLPRARSKSLSMSLLSPSSKL